MSDDPTQSKFRRHFFVCLMNRPPDSKPSCGAKGSADVYNALMEGLGAHEDMWETVNVTTAGCMGPCFDGPMVVCYPEGVWYKGVTRADVKEIVSEHMVKGEPVERLRYEWPKSED